MQLEEINQNILVKEGKLKRYRDRVKQSNQNRIFQKNERKFYLLLGGECTRNYQQPDENEAKIFWSKIWQRK